jgi:phenylacetate-coenzyme A ligase PaaK-like adenylate-forming protein
MITRDELFRTGNQERIWQKYCGFLDLSLSEFMEIQEQLLMDQIELVHNSPLAKKFMPRKPKDVAEFRKIVPLTTYKDYAEYLDAKNEDVLAVKPYCWVCTSGRGGTFKWVPYTETAIEKFGMYGLATMILASTGKKGEVNIGSSTRILYNVPPRPYLSGILARVVTEVLGSRSLLAADKYENMEFEDRVQAGFQIALRTGVDLLGSLTSVLIRMGERFAESSGRLKLNRHMAHPQVLFRLLVAWLRCKRKGRNILPRDLWSLKGLICYGMDTAIYREQLKYYWGKEPLEGYAATEAGGIATQAWNKKTMTFVPSSCFLEFIPEEEWLKSRENKDYHPSTVLLDHVEAGKRYEIVFTSFYGMPFLRYRLGDLIRIVALEDKEAGIKIPQMVFDSRADDLIDVAGFARLDEKSIWQAIANTGIKYEDWSARKEYEQGDPVIRLYIELKEVKEAEDLAKLIHQELSAVVSDYKDLENMLGIRPLRVTLLPAGSFQRYYEKRKKAGADLAHLKPPHMNASDTIIRDLVGHGVQLTT